MLVDMHLHECTYSSDSKISLEEIVTTARGRGLDAVCITDHDSMGLRNMRQSIQTGPVFPFLWVLSSFPFRGISRRGELKIIPAAGGCPGFYKPC